MFIKAKGPIDMYLCRYLKIGSDKVYFAITNQYLIPVSVLYRKTGTYTGITKENKRKNERKKLLFRFSQHAVLRLALLPLRRRYTV